MPYKSASLGSVLLPPPPPSVRPNVVYKDKGNCSPRYLRLSSYTVPADKATVTKTNLPFGAIVSPLADPVQGDGGDGCVTVPTQDPSGGEPPSCEKCGAYLNPFITYDSVGETYVCPLCGNVNKCKC